MSETVQYLIGESVGQEYEIPCTKCAGRTAHKSVASVDVRGEQHDGGASFDWSVDYQVIQCLGCKTLSFRVASTNSENIQHTSETDYEYVVQEKLYPPRVEGRRGIGDETYYFPAPVAKIYDETLTALTNQAPVLAAIGLRALVETICKEKQAKGRTLIMKIDNLVEQQVLTPTSANILHKIRSIGNAAAHSVKPHTEKQLGLAMDIVENLLRDVYILPKKAEAEFE